MNPSFSSASTRLMLEFAILLANGIMAMVLFVAGTNQAQARYAANYFESLSQPCFIVGLLTLLVVASVVGRILRPSTKMMLMLAITLWNQVWLAAFVLSMIPFRLF